MDETVSYQPHPEDKTRTLLKQEAVVTVQGIPLNSYMEDLLTSTIMVNANKVHSPGGARLVGRPQCVIYKRSPSYVTDRRVWGYFIVNTQNQ